MRKDEGKGNLLLEIILTIVASIIFMLIGIYYIPEIMFLYPVFFVVLGVRYGIGYNILSLLLSILILGLIVDLVFATSTLLIFGLLSIVLNHMIKNRKRSFDIVLVSTLSLIISFLLIIIIMNSVAGVSFISQLEDRLVQLVNSQMSTFNNMDLSSYEMLKIDDGLQNLMKYTMLIMPALIMISSLAMAYLNYFTSVVVLRRLGYGIVQIPRFSRFQLPSNIILGTGIMFIGAFILKGLQLFHYETILLNIMVIVSFMFFIQGLAVINYKLTEKRVPILLRLLIMVIFVLMVFVSWIILILGILDVIIDFRKLRKPI